MTTTDPALAALRRARAQQRAVQRWLSLGGPLLIGYWAWVCWHDSPRPGLSGRGLVISVAFVGLVVGATGLRAVLLSASGTRPGLVASRAAGTPGGWPRLTPHGMFLLLLLASSALLLWAQPGTLGIIGMLTCVLLVARRLPARVGLPLAFAGLAGVALLSRHGSDGALGLAGFAAFYAMTYLANQLGQANEQAERLLTELEHTRAAEQRAAGLAERQRLAREMHDVLAHSLSGLLLQLEAARMLAAASPADPRLPGAIERARQLGSAGLAEASRAIGMLRDDDLPGPERLPGLTARFTADRGVPCELDVSGQARSLPEEARLAVYRVAQEALTNIARHAAPERVLVSLAYEPGSTRLTVEDFAAAAGVGAATARAAGATATGGYGLTGMRERAELLGGELAAAATAHGFRVELRVPA